MCYVLVQMEQGALPPTIIAAVTLAEPPVGQAMPLQIYKTESLSKVT